MLGRARVWKKVFLTESKHMITGEKKADRYCFVVLFLCLSIHQVKSRSLLYQLTLWRMELLCNNSCNNSQVKPRCLSSRLSSSQLSNTMQSRCSNATAVLLSSQKNVVSIFFLVCVFIWLALKNVLLSALGCKCRYCFLSQAVFLFCGKSGVHISNTWGLISIWCNGQRPSCFECRETGYVSCGESLSSLSLWDNK